MYYVNAKDDQTYKTLRLEEVPLQFFRGMGSAYSISGPPRPMWREITGETSTHTTTEPRAFLGDPKEKKKQGKAKIFF
jgi:hypothetical protein